MMEERRKDICVIIPTYNNAGTVLDVVTRALAQNMPVVVVDDGCTDGTQALLSGADLPVKVLRHEHNRGKGIALRTGLEYARKEGYRYAVTLDADGQHYPEDLPLYQRIILTNLLLNVKARPDFIAFKFEDRFCRCNRRAVDKLGLQEVSWTIRNKEDLNTVEEAGAIPIFETFDPDA